MSNQRKEEDRSTRAIPGELRTAALPGSRGDGS